jgi:hypothetical protein
MSKSALKALRDYQGNLAVQTQILNVPNQVGEVQDGDLVIAVFPSSWVFIGFATKLPSINGNESSRIRLDCVFNIHRWGTKEGLGEIAVGGPTSETVLYPAGPVHGAPIFLMKADVEKWLK